MQDIPSRVAECFLSVFPELKLSDLPGASHESLTQWDSVAHVRLLATIAEEFQIELDDESFDSLTSYPLIVSFVETHAGPQAQ